VRPAVAYGAALAGDCVGAAGALLASTRTWQTVTIARPAPLPADVLPVDGRTVDAAPTALALVALAGVVAVLATRGAVRRVVGALLVVDGALLLWRALGAMSAVGVGRARTLVTSRHGTVDAAAVVPQVSTHGVWAVLTLLCAVLVVAAGALIAWRGHRWQSLSSRYERAAPAASAASAASDEEAERSAARAAASMWTSLDRGDDPTAT
jgi:uncharacterized membrane protein (TIGR02234 family)